MLFFYRHFFIINQKETFAGSFYIQKQANRMLITTLCIHKVTFHA